MIEQRLFLGHDFIFVMTSRLLRHPLLQGMLARLIALYLRAVWLTTRWTLVGEGWARAHLEGAVIVAFWHERLPLAPFMWWVLCRRWPAWAGRQPQVLISRHRDGQLIATAMRPFGIGAVHASSSRGGAMGLRALARILAAAGVAVITPDGPRGPARVAQPGVAQLAALTGAPVLPCGIALSRVRLARSWDRMRFPLPFARGVVVLGEPITIARHEAAAALPRIAAAITAATDHAEALLRA